MVSLVRDTMVIWIFNLDGPESRLMPVFMDYQGLQNQLKLVLQSGHHNPGWPPKWPL